MVYRGVNGSFKPETVEEKKKYQEVRYEASSGVNGSLKPETEGKDPGVSAAALAVGAVAGAAMAAWGISKWLSGSSSDPVPDPDPRKKVKMMKAPGKDEYIPRQGFEESPRTYFRNLRNNR